MTRARTLDAGEIVNRDRLIARVGEHVSRAGEALRAAGRLSELERTAEHRRLARRLRAMGRELAWLGSGRIDAPRRRRLDLVALVRRIARAWNRATEPGAASGELTRSGGTIRVEGRGPLVDLWDAEQIGAILGELLSNAAKSGAGAPVVVRVATAAQRRVRVTVDNAAEGTPPRGPFRRFVRGARPTGQGMGVGLWLVDALARANGGDFGFVQAPGGGVRAVVHLARAGQPFRRLAT